MTTTLESPVAISGTSPFPGVRAVDYRHREAWLQGRRLRLGSSDTAGIFGVGYADQSPLSVFASKVNPPEPEDLERVDKRLRIGLLIEPALRSIFSAETGWPCEEVGRFTVLESPETPFLAATLDGWVDHPEYGPVPWEGKNIDAFNRREWKDSDEPPLRYQIQCQHHMAVTGASHCFLFGLVGGNDPHVVTVERNESFIEAMLARLAEFWAIVERRDVPALMAPPWSEFANHAAERSILARLFPETEEGLTVQLPPEAMAWHTNLEAAKAAAKAAGEEADKWGNKLRAAIGEASFGEFGSIRYSYRTQNRKGYYVEPSTSRVLRAVK